MQTMHPVLKRGGLFSDWELLPPEVFHARVARVQAAMAEAGDDAWLVYGDAEDYGNVAWVSHFLPRLRSALVLVPRTGEPVVMAACGLRDVPASKVLTWVAELRPFTRLPGELAKLVADRGLDAGQIGLVGTRSTMPLAEWLAIGAELPKVRWVQRDDAFAAVRSSFESADVRALERSAAVVQIGLEEAASALRGGRSVRQAVAQIDRAMRRAAAEDVRVLLASGSQVAQALRPPDDRTLVDDDVVLLYLSAQVQRYWVEAAQTFALGAVPPATRALVAQAAAAVEAMRAALRPGAFVADVVTAARGALGERRFAQAASYGLGHGIGLESDAPPQLDASVDRLVPPNGALSLHVVLHDDGTGAAVGQTVVLENGRPRPLIDPLPLVELSAEAAS